MKTTRSKWLKRTLLLAISASSATMVSLVSGTLQNDRGDPANATSLTALPGSEPLEIFAPERPADKRAARLKHSYDAGDFYYYRGERMPLLRSLRELAVEFKEGTQDQRKQDVIGSAFFDVQLVDTGRVRGRPVMLAELGEAASVKELEDVLQTVTVWAEVNYAFPVLLHPQGGERFILTDEVVVKLHPGAKVEQVVSAYEKGCLGVAKQVWGTDDQYVLQVRQPKKIDPLQVANTLSESGAVAWAEPNFIQEAQLAYTPSDPLYDDQWSLNNDGDLEATLESKTEFWAWAADLSVDSPADADVDAPQAWDLSLGSGDIVIAVIDTGMDLAHEDLVDNLFRNEREISGNGVDDDGNGYIDDVHGWDFLDHDNDPSHSEEDMGHGTAVAGIVAARGDNSIGVSGICPQCRVLPLRWETQSATGSFVSTDDVSVAEAIQYAASLADVVNNSWGIYPAEVVTTAVEDAVRIGRDGKGTVMVFAIGNSASGLTYRSVWSTPGTHRFRLSYTKDDAESGGDDTAWLAWMASPEGDVISFENGLPQGWDTFGDAPWKAIDDPVHADESACITHPLRAGAIADGQTSNLTYLMEQTEPGITWVRFWVSSERDADGLQFLFDADDDGTVEYSSFISGVPTVLFEVAYPASLPETIAVGASSNWDCRIHYSRFGEEVDFLAPSSARYLTAPIVTTDRTDELGYDATDYTRTFRGTSAAAPLAAGLAGLILSAAPELTAERVRQLMRETADKVGPEPYVDGRNDRYGYGRINAHRALVTAVGGSETADLVVAKTANADRVHLHEMLTYTISVTNAGPSEATNVTVIDTLPREVILKEASEGCGLDRSTLICSAASIQAGQSKAYELEVEVWQFPDDRLLRNQVTVTADQDDLNEGNNSAEALAHVIGEISLRTEEGEHKTMGHTPNNTQ